MKISQKSIDFKQALSNVGAWELGKTARRAIVKDS